MAKTEAWLLYPGEQTLSPAVLQPGRIEIPKVLADEVLVEPLYGCWEANMDHALARQPIDICQARGEPYAVLGNAGVVRVLKVGESVQQLAGDQVCLILSFAKISHPLNYPKAAHAYDAPGTIGLLAKRTKVHASQLIPLPEDTPFSLPQWAAFSLRYITAWGNWQVAQATYRAMVSQAEFPDPWVIAWGGGVALAEIQLAQAAGFNGALFSSRPARKTQLKRLGIQALTRPEHLDFDAETYAQDAEYRKRYREAESQFLNQIQTLTQGRGAGIFIDMIGGGVMRATLKALGWPGVLTTAGWKAGLDSAYNRALACMHWQCFVHTHYARPQQALAAVDYALQNDWMPPEPPYIYRWDEIPQLAQDYQQGMDDYFPVYQINT